MRYLIELGMKAGPYFGTILSDPPHLGEREWGEWSDTQSGKCRGNVRRRISANFWKWCEISGRETTHRVRRSVRAQSALAKFVAGSSGDLSTTFLA